MTLPQAIGRAARPGSLSLRAEVAAYKKELIFRAACQAFWEHGYHDTTVEMLAARLDGSKAIFYYYYADKRAVLEEVYRRSLAEAQEIARAALTKELPATSRLLEFARAYVRWVVDNQALVDVFWREERMLSPAKRHEIALEQKRFDDMIAQMLRQGVDEGVFRVRDLTMTARAIAGMATFTSNWWKPGGRVGRDEVAEQFAQLALRLAGAAAAPARSGRP